jgi:hypothetical protein
MGGCSCEAVADAFIRALPVINEYPLCNELTNVAARLAAPSQTGERPWSFIDCMIEQP